jgi:hypothetical protein
MDIKLNGVFLEGFEVLSNFLVSFMKKPMTIPIFDESKIISYRGNS